MIFAYFGNSLGQNCLTIKFFAFHWPLFLPRTIALISIAADRRKFRQCCKVSYSLQSTRKPQMMLVYTSLHLHIYFQMIVFVFVFSMFSESDEKLHRPVAMRIMLGVKMSYQLGRLKSLTCQRFFSNQTKWTVFIVFRYQSETILRKTCRYRFLI